MPGLGAVNFLVEIIDMKHELAFLKYPFTILTYESQDARRRRLSGIMEATRSLE